MANSGIAAIHTHERLGVFFHPHKDPTLEEVLESVKQILKEKGCPSCGLNGFDLNLAKARIGNPVGPELGQLGVSHIVLEQGFPTQTLSVGR
jgi:hypothetical protein